MRNLKVPDLTHADLVLIHILRVNLQFTCTPLHLIIFQYTAGRSRLMFKEKLLVKHAYKNDDSLRFPLHLNCVYLRWKQIHNKNKQIKIIIIIIITSIYTAYKHHVQCQREAESEAQ